MIERDEKTRKVFGRVRLQAVVMMVVAPLVFAAVPIFIAPMQPFESGGPKMLVYILLIVAVFTPMLYPIIERVQISTYRKLGDKSRMTPLQMYFVQQLIRFSLTEAVFIFALAVFFLTGRQDYFWYFFPIGVFWVVLAWPTESKFETYLKKVEIAMSGKINKDEIDQHYIMIKPLYFGLIVNILIPMALILVCYFIETKSGGRLNRIGDFANSLFYILIAIGIAQSLLAFWMRQKLYGEPMVKSAESFQEDMAHGLLAKSRPIFTIIAIVALYGIAYYFLTGRFLETVVIVFFSFAAFQVVRPRFGFLEKLIAKQAELLENPGAPRG